MMEAFPFVQQFFTTLQCPHCGAHLQEQGISLIKEENEVFLVHIDCGVCESHVGVAMVGVETIQAGRPSRKASLTDAIASAIELMERKTSAVDEFSIVEDEEDDDDDDNHEENIDYQEDQQAGFERLIEAVKAHNTSTSLKVPHFAGALGLGGAVRRRYVDPELPPEERKRLAKFKPVETDDVIEAHQFISGLGKDWMKHIPKEMLERCTTPEMESEER
ncbi:MAG: hypothetical protein NTW61_08940 [Candidatus Melainabacteria bacterium]|nr:hypothetical protein [Candidatus Melainabacteria bacterium]